MSELLHFTLRLESILAFLEQWSSTLAAEPFGVSSKKYFSSIFSSSILYPQYMFYRANLMKPVIRIKIQAKVTKGNQNTRDVYAADSLKSNDC